MKNAQHMLKVIANLQKSNAATAAKLASLQQTLENQVAAGSAIGNAAKSVKSSNVVKTVKTDKSAKTDKAAKTDKPAKTDKSAVTGKIGKSSNVAKTVKLDKSATVAKSTKPSAVKTASSSINVKRPK